MLRHERSGGEFKSILSPDKKTLEKVMKEGESLKNSLANLPPNDMGIVWEYGGGMPLQDLGFWVNQTNWHHAQDSDDYTKTDHANLAEKENNSVIVGKGSPLSKTFKSKTFEKAYPEQMVKDIQKTGEGD